MSTKWIVIGIFGLTLVLPACAPAAAEGLAKLQPSPDSARWELAVDGAGLVLVVSGPEGFYLRQEYAAGEAPSFSVYDDGGNLRPTGVYVWELRAVLPLAEESRRELELARLEGAGTLRKAGKPASGPVYQSGSFSIVEGRIVAGDLEEPRPEVNGIGNALATKGAVLTNADGIIRNSLCVGFDCPNSPPFSDSTILLMENNTRIKFGDTSNSPFPNNDWEIEANSSSSGGQSYLGFNDCGTADNDGGCATDLVFAVEAGARQNALYVESDGDVGIGTSNPVVRLHATDGDTPALRLEQDASSGFQPQVWDVAGNETSFFVRDATNGSTLPFRVFPGMPSNALVLRNDNVGLGTTSPSASLHVSRSDGSAQVLVTETSGTSAQRTLVRLENNGAPAFTFQNTAATGSWSFFHANNDRFVISRDGSGTQEFAVAANGDILVGGAVVHTSAREAKENFRLPDSQAVLAKVAKMPILEWTYKTDAGRALHLGPIAEDFYAAFGLGADDKHIALNDSIGVALLAIQGLDEVVNEKDRRIEKLEAEVGELKLLVQELASRRSDDGP